jgi:hypothetical protein
MRSGIEFMNCTFGRLQVCSRAKARLCVTFAGLPRALHQH